MLLTTGGPKSTSRNFIFKAKSLSYTDTVNIKTTLPVQVNKGHGEPVILLHGLGTNYKSWTYVLRALDYSRLHVIALDLLGFGDAPKPQEIDYTLAEHAKAVIATLDKLGIDDAVIAGHSMGCLVALEIARTRPDLAKRLILLGAPLYKTIPQHSRPKWFMNREGTYFKIFNLLKHNPEMTITAAKSADRLLPVLHGMEVTKETWPAFRASLTHTIMQTKSYETACHIQTPVLLVYGVLDFFVSKRNLRDVVRQNRTFVRMRTVLGPHEITPLQGKKIARIITKATLD